MAEQRAGSESLSTSQKFYCGTGPRILQTLLTVERLGHPRRVGPWCDRIERDWRRWNREHGFEYRCAIGFHTLTDRDRLAAGEEPRPGAPPPPYLDLLA